MIAFQHDTEANDFGLGDYSDLDTDCSTILYDSDCFESFETVTISG